MNGFDVSHYQGVIDWDLVTGLDFVFCKATQGLDGVDPTFARNIEGALGAGLKVGAYHFFDPKFDAKAQAAHFLSMMKPEYFPMALALDVEDADGWSELTLQQKAANVQDFLDTIEEEAKGHPIIYTYKSFADAHLTAVPFGAYKLWLARYKPDMPSGWVQWHLWQYAYTGTVPGISGQVDLDRLSSDAQWGDLTCRGKS